MNKIHVIAISGNAVISRFMQDADLFERFKIIAIPTSFELTLKEGCTKVKALDDLKRLLEAHGHRVAAVFIPNDPEGAWRDPDVRVTSNGQKFCLLEDYLNHYGFVQDAVLIG